VQHLAVGIKFKVPALFGCGLFWAGETDERNHQSSPVAEQDGELVLADVQSAGLGGRGLSCQSVHAISVESIALDVCNRRHSSH